MPPTRRGRQVVRSGSAKPLFVGSIPTRASKRVLANRYKNGLTARSVRFFVFAIEGLCRSPKAIARRGIRKKKPFASTTLLREVGERQTLGPMCAGGWLRKTELRPLRPVT